MKTIVLVRHGESVWNKDNRFTGWTDVDLSEKGIIEAKKVGQVLGKNGYIFDVAYTSALKRTIRTLWLVLDEMDLMWIPEYHSWRLNERHYGALQGLDKAETAAQYGEQQISIWRRSYDTQPPALKKSDERYPGNDPKYKELAEKDLPLTESLEDTMTRFIPFWHEVLAPTIRTGKRAIVIAHGNSLRAMVKYLDNIPDSEIVGLDIPTGIPLIYEFDDNLRPIRHYYQPMDDRLRSS